MASLESDQSGPHQQERADEMESSWQFEEGTLVELRGVDSTGKQRCWNRLVQNEWTFETVSDLIRRKAGASDDQRIEVSCSKMLDGGQKKEVIVRDASDVDTSQPRSSLSAFAHIVQFTVLPPSSASNSSSTSKEPAAELSAPTRDDELVEKMIDVVEQDQSDEGEEEKEDPVSSSSSKRGSAEVGNIANGDEEDKSTRVGERRRGRSVEEASSQPDVESQERERPTKKIRKEAKEGEQQQQHVDESSSRLPPEISIITSTTTSPSPPPIPHLTLPQLSASVTSKRKLATASEPSPSLSKSTAPNHYSPPPASRPLADPSKKLPSLFAPLLPLTSPSIDTAPSVRSEDPSDDKEEGAKRRRVDQKTVHIDEEEIRERSVTTEGTDVSEEGAGGKRENWFKSKKKEKTTKQQQPKEERRRTPKITTPPTLYKPPTPPPPPPNWRYTPEGRPRIPTVPATTSFRNLSSVTSRCPPPNPSRSHVTPGSSPRVKAVSILGPSPRSLTQKEPAGNSKSVKFEKDATAKSKTRSSSSRRTHPQRKDVADGLTRRTSAEAASSSVVGAGTRTGTKRKKVKRTASWQRAWMTILPWVLDHDLDASTLASLARVSRTSLHIVGPLLYTNISLSSFQQWKSVFWFETPSPLRSHLGRDLVFTATLDLSSTELEVVSTLALAGSFSSSSSGSFSSSSLARITIVLPPLPSSSDPSSLTYASLKGAPLGTLMSSVLSLLSTQGANASDGGPWVLVVARSDEDVEVVTKSKELVWRFEEERDELGSDEEDSWEMCEVVRGRRE